MVCLLGVFKNTEVWRILESFVHDHRDLARAALAMLPLGHPSPEVYQSPCGLLHEIHGHLDALKTYQTDVLIQELEEETLGQLIGQHVFGPDSRTS